MAPATTGCASLDAAGFATMTNIVDLDPSVTSDSFCNVLKASSSAAWLPEAIVQQCTGDAASCDVVCRRYYRVRPSDGAHRSCGSHSGGTKCSDASDAVNYYPCPTTPPPLSPPPSQPPPSPLPSPPPP
eukprot:6863970-Prymnesium_polylepis.1